MRPRCSDKPAMVHGNVRSASVRTGVNDVVTRFAGVARFARGLQDALRAIKAGLTLEWSNGVTEGHVHRLKLVKRQGYGRAGFARLRQRVLQAA
jgi:transposase